MLVSYVTTALRSFAQHKQHALLSLVGLSLGMAMLMLIGLFIQHELSFEQGQPDQQNHYRLVMHAQENGNEYILTTPRAHQQLLDIPGVESVFYLLKTQMVSDDKVAIGNNAFQLAANYAATPNLAKLVNIDVLAGDLTTTLNTPEKIALSRSEATRLFGAFATPDKVIGRTLKLQRNNRLLSVSAVFSDLPVNSHFYFHSLTSIEPFMGIRGNVMHTYVALLPNRNMELVAQSATKIYTQIWQWQNIDYWLQPIKDIHLGPNFAQDMKIGGDATSVMICAVMALVLLIISCVNYINFSVAQSSNRAKEIGVRKAMGATRAQLITQFMSESILLAWFAMLVACVLVELFLPSFMQLIGRPLPALDWPIWLGQIFVLATGIGVLSGLYPSMYMAGFNTKAILNGELKQGRQGVWIRKALLLLQMGLSVGLLISAMMLSKQLHFLHSLPVNYQKSQQLVINNMPQKALYGEQSASLLASIESIPGVTASVAMDFSITQSTNAGLFVKLPQTPDTPLSLSLAGVHGKVVETLGLTLLAGRDFSDEFASDRFNRDTEQGSIIVPESVLNTLGFNSPEDAIGKPISFFAGPFSNATGTIVGVVTDIKVGPVNHQGAPVVFVNGLGVGGTYSLLVKVENPNDAQLKLDLQNFVKARLNIAPVDITLLEDDYQALYREQQKLSEVVAIGGVISLILILMGVFGLTGFIVKQRQKEVAVRKVLGASRLVIINGLAKEFMMLVLFGCAIAWPICFLILSDWLASFEQSVTQSIWVYMVASLFISLITWSTVAGLTFKAASIRPAQVLRYE